MESNSKKSFWDSKPFWCQPWSIIFFGILVLITSWIIFNNFIVNALLGFLIIIWWVVFLILVPENYQGISDSK